MALTVEELQVIIAANIDPFRQDLRQVISELKNFRAQSGQTGDSIQKGVFGSMLKANLVGQAITATFQKLTRVAGDMASEIVSGGSALSRLTTVNQIVARNVGVTSEELNNLRDSLAEANTYGTQAEQVIRSLMQSGLVQLSKELRAVDARTNKTVEGVTALTLVMKDLAAAAGISSAEGIEKVTRFIQRGESAFVDGLIELGNLNKEYQDFAATLGKTRGDLTAQEEAMARMNIVMREGEKVWGAYAAASQTSGKALADIPKIIKSILELIGQALEPILAVVSNAFVQFFVGVRSQAQASSGSIKDWAVKVAGYLVGIIRVIGTMLSWLPFIGKGFQNLAKFSLKPVATQAKLADRLASTGSAAKGAAADVKKLNKELNTLAGFDEMEVLSKSSGDDTTSTPSILPLTGDALGGGDIGLNNEDIAKINSLGDEVVKKLEDLKEKIRKFFEPVMKFLQPVFDLLKRAWEYILNNKDAVVFAIGVVAAAFLITLLPAIGSVVVAALGVIAPFLLIAAVAFVVYKAWTENWFGIRDTVTNVWNNYLYPILSTIWKWLTEQIPKAVKTMRDRFQANWEEIKNIAAFVWEKGIKPVWETLKNYINGFLIPVFQNIKTVASLVWNAVADVVSTVWGKIRGAIQPGLDWMSTKIAPVLENLKGKMENIFTGIKDAAAKAWEGVVYIFKTGINFVISFLNGFITKVNKLLDGMNAVGQNIPGWKDITFRIGTIPFLAKGGIIDSPTLGVLGEAGKEAVVPLENNTEWIDMLADKLNSRGGDSAKQLIINLGQERIFDMFIDYVNDKTMVSGIQQLKI